MSGTLVKQATYPVASATATAAALRQLQLGTAYTLLGEALDGAGSRLGSSSRAFSTPALAAGPL